MTLKRVAASLFLLTSTFLITGPVATAAADPSAEVCYSVNVQANDTAVSEADCISN